MVCLVVVVVDEDAEEDSAISPEPSSKHGVIQFSSFVFRNVRDSSSSPLLLLMQGL